MTREEFQKTVSERFKNTESGFGNMTQRELILLQIASNVHDVMCGFCRDCKYYTQDKEYSQVYTCENQKLKLGIMFSFEGGCLSVEPDFGCVQFENHTQRTYIANSKY